MNSRNRFNRVVVATVAAAAAVGGYAVLKGHESDKSDYSVYVDGMESPLQPVNHDYDLAFRAIKRGFLLHRDTADQDIASITDPALQAHTRRLEQLAEAYTALKQADQAVPTDLSKIDTARKITDVITNPAAKRRADRGIETDLAALACQVVNQPNRVNGPYQLAAEAADKINWPHLAQQTQNVIKRAQHEGGLEYASSRDIDFCMQVWQTSDNTQDYLENELFYSADSSTDIERHTTSYRNHYIQYQFGQLLSPLGLEAES